MTLSGRRVGAILRKELREYRRTGSIVSTMVAIPLAFLVFPLLFILALPSGSSSSISESYLVYFLGIPALVPTAVAAYSVVGERQQGTLEPVLSTPVRREEFLLGKALAAFIPSLVISYAVLGFFLACVKLFAHPGVASAVIRGPALLALLLFTPLLTTWSIWIGMAISARCSDVRVAQQLGALAGVPAVLVSTLIAFGAIHATRGLVIALVVLLLALDRLGWWITSKAFDRERLVTGART